MKTLERHRIDGIVRELETGGYGLALTLGMEPASAERILLEAFASLAPSVPRTTRIVELRKQLDARIRRHASNEWVPAKADAGEAAAATVSENLHLRLVDIVEERQSDEPAGRRRAVLIAFIGAAIVAGGIVFVRVHADALAAAQPTINELSPPSAASGVPVSGDVRVTFGRRPSGTPTMHLEPAHAALELVHWDGNTLVAVYAGLHLSTRYQVVLQADYRSRLADVAHFEKRWTVTTQGYPVVALTPAQDQRLVPRVGKLSVGFSYVPPAKPRLTISPTDGVLTPGQWAGTAWTASYSGLKPLTQYQVTLTVDYGAAAAATQRQWAFWTEPGWPASGVPVIWYGTSNLWTQPGDQRLVAIDWQGNQAGSLYPTAVVLQQAPDGSALLTQDGGYIDGNGAAAGTTPNSSPIGLAADDSKSVCKLAGTGQLWLVTGPVRGPMRRVAPMGSTGGRSSNDVIACSVQSDRAVIADNGMTGTAAIRVIALSTGRLLYQQSYGGANVWVISSRDGRYLAEQTSTLDTKGKVTAAVTLIRRTLDGKIVARLDNRRVVRFSWDGMRLVTLPFLSGNDVTLLDWQTGHILWQRAADATDGRPAYAMAQPNGPAMAIAFGGQPQTGNVDELWIVAADGQATQVVSSVFYPVFGAGF